MPSPPPPRQPGNVILFPDAPDSFARAKLHLTFDCRCCPGAVVCAPCTKLLGPEACPHAAPGHPGYCIKVCDCINENSFTAIGGGAGVSADGEPAGSMNWRNRQSGFCSLPLTCYNFSYTTRRVALPDGTPIQPNWDLYKKWRALPHRPSPPVVAAVSSLARHPPFSTHRPAPRSLTHHLPTAQGGGEDRHSSHHADEDESLPAVAPGRAQGLDAPLPAPDVD